MANGRVERVKMCNENITEVRNNKNTYDSFTGTSLEKLIDSASDILDRLKTVADADGYKQICIDAFDTEIEFFESIECMYVPA